MKLVKKIVCMCSVILYCEAVCVNTMADSCFLRGMLHIQAHTCLAPGSLFAGAGQDTTKIVFPEGFTSDPLLSPSDTRSGIKKRYRAPAVPKQIQSFHELDAFLEKQQIEVIFIDLDHTVFNPKERLRSLTWMKQIAAKVSSDVMLFLDRTNDLRMAETQMYKPTEDDLSEWIAAHQNKGRKIVGVTARHPELEVSTMTTLLHLTIIPDDIFFCEGDAGKYEAMKTYVLQHTIHRAVFIDNSARNAQAIAKKQGQLEDVEIFSYHYDNEDTSSKDKDANYYLKQAEKIGFAGMFMYCEYLLNAMDAAAMAHAPKEKTRIVFDEIGKKIRKLVDSFNPQKKNFSDIPEPFRGLVAHMFAQYSNYTGIALNNESGNIGFFVNDPYKDPASYAHYKTKLEETQRIQRAA